MRGGRGEGGHGDELGNLEEGGRGDKHPTPGLNSRLQHDPPFGDLINT